ncbi:hypothetical protein GCM10023191_090120 [Actinoallomurus oryzae]|jgi:hypothetical protein|uniref:Uncharacterized protein n=1 Tax=Actinoallomurus oryzae TaxID=502180 RepID=A0ABP8R4W8_9ACTN
MNRPLVLTCVALSAVMPLTGCGGSKKAATVAHSASPKARHHAPAATRAPSASATVAGTVRVGGFCKATDTVGRTANGGWARCLKKPGDKRARWYSQAPATGARAGEFCSRAGATATSSTGKKLTCTKKSGETRPRWRTK